jgi:hypothetical protein
MYMDAPIYGSSLEETQKSLYQKIMWWLGIDLINSLIPHEHGLGVLFINFFILNALFTYEG